MSRDRGTVGAPRCWEVPAVVLAAVVSMAVVALASRRLWFLDDSWDFLTGRSPADPGDWLEPHAGHWQTTTVAAYHALKPLFGLDYWPWYFLPRLAGYAAFCVGVWYLLRRRGADPVLAFGAYGALTVLGLSGWHNLATVNNLVTLAVLYHTALAVAARPSPTPRDLWTAGGLLTLALMSGSLALAAWAGVAAGVVVARQLRGWWPALAGSAAVYGSWWLGYGAGSGQTPDVTLGAVAAVPGGIFDVLRYSLPSLLALPDAAGPYLAAGLIAGMVWMALRGMIGPFEVALLTTLVVFLALVVIARIHPGQAFPNAERYGFNVGLLLLPVVVPHLRLPPVRFAVPAAAVVLAAVTAGNLADLAERLDWWEDRAQASRAVVEAAGTVVARGEPALPSAAVDPPRSGVLTADRLAGLLAGGWVPPPPVDPAVVADVRARFRMRPLPGGTPRGTRPRTGHDLVDGCAAVGAGETLEAAVVGPGAIGLEGEQGSTIALDWEDRFALAARTVVLDDRFAGGAVVTLAAPVGPATLRVRADGGVRVCGLAPA